MPRKPGVSFYRGWWVTKAGCGDGPPRKLAKASCKSDRESRRLAEAELRKLVVGRDEGRRLAMPASLSTVGELIEKFLDHIKVGRSASTYSDYRNELGKLIRGFPWRYQSRLKRDDPGPRHLKGEPFTEGIGRLRARDLTPTYRYQGARSIVRSEPPKVPWFGDEQLQLLLDIGDMDSHEVDVLKSIPPDERMLILWDASYKCWGNPAV